MIAEEDELVTLRDDPDVAHQAAALHPANVGLDRVVAHLGRAEERPAPLGEREVVLRQLDEHLAAIEVAHGELAPALGGRPDGAVAPASLTGLVAEHPARRVRTEVVEREIDLDVAPADTSDAYLRRLHLLSHRLVRPHAVDVTGIFGVLANVVWTNVGPCPVDGFEETRAALRGSGTVQVLGVDKFPRMVDYVLPRASGSPTPTGSASAPTSRRARP